jgi:hypothetical protein
MSRAQGDRITAKLLDDPERVEVLSWLREGVEEERTLGQYGSRARSVELANEIYGAGAHEVWAVEIDRYIVPLVEGDRRHANSGKLVVRLPADARLRKRFFAWDAKHSRSLGFDPRKDEGQEYLFIPLD